MLGKAFHIVRVAAIAAGVMAAGAAAAETPNGPDWGVKAISKLSDADLVITSPAGKAFMDKLAPDHDKACGKPDENRPDFDEYCSWAFNNEEADFDIHELKRLFDKDSFFIKLSPINPNAVSEKNNLGLGAVEGINIL